MTKYSPPTDKLLDRGVLARKADEWRVSGTVVVFTNGCFDILHAGHVHYLSAARSEGDVLVVGLNSDTSVREIKGVSRPINPQRQRAEVLSALTCVDAICVFDEPDPLELIRAARPHVLVKGEDWAETEIVGADFVRQGGGRVVRVPLLPDVSTSRIIERVLKRFSTVAS